MKKYSKLAVALVAGWCILQAGQALADPVTVHYTDGPNAQGYYIFPSFNSALGVSPNTDAIAGWPDVQTMDVKIDGATGKLESITLNFTGVSYNPLSYVTSLFINSTGQGENWDYFVSSGTVGSTVGTVAVAGVYTVNHFDPSNPNDYNRANGGRSQHANGINANSSLGLLTKVPGIGIADVISTLPANNGYSYSIVYDLSSLSIDLGTQFTIGWTPYCANDVVYAVLGWAGPSGSAPEPATMMLMGVGLAGLAGWRNRRQAVKK